MRITKRIEAYVKEQVKKGLPYGAPTADFKAAKEQQEKIVLEIKQKVYPYIDQLCAEANAKLPEGFKVARSNWSCIDYTSYSTPLANAADKHEREIDQKRKAAVESILLSLELGATKADLERLISEAIS